MVYTVKLGGGEVEQCNFPVVEENKTEETGFLAYHFVGTPKPYSAVI